MNFNWRCSSQLLAVTPTQAILKFSSIMLDMKRLSSGSKERKMLECLSSRGKRQERKSQVMTFLWLHNDDDIWNVFPCLLILSPFVQLEFLSAESIFLIDNFNFSLWIIFHINASQWSSKTFIAKRRGFVFSAFDRPSKSGLRFLIKGSLFRTDGN